MFLFEVRKYLISGINSVELRVSLRYEAGCFLFCVYENEYTILVKRRYLLPYCTQTVQNWCIQKVAFYENSIVDISKNRILASI